MSTKNLTTARVIEALELNGGIKTAAAIALGIGRTTLYRFIDSNPECRAKIEEIDNMTLDLAEGQILKAIKDGDRRTCMWYLELKGHQRGYSRQHRHAGPNGGAIPVTPATFDATELSTDALREIQIASVKGSTETDHGQSD